MQRVLPDPTLSLSFPHSFPFFPLFPFLSPILTINGEAIEALRPNPRLVGMPNMHCGTKFYTTGHGC